MRIVRIQQVTGDLRTTGMRGTLPSETTGSESATGFTAVCPERPLCVSLRFPVRSNLTAARSRSTKLPVGRSSWTADETSRSRVSTTRANWSTRAVGRRLLHRVLADTLYPSLPRLAPASSNPSSHRAGGCVDTRRARRRGACGTSSAAKPAGLPAFL